MRESQRLQEAQAGLVATRSSRGLLVLSRISSRLIITNSNPATALTARAAVEVDSVFLRGIAELHSHLPCLKQGKTLLRVCFSDCCPCTELEATPKPPKPALSCRSAEKSSLAICTALGPNNYWLHSMLFLLCLVCRACHPPGIQWLHSTYLLHQAFP